MVRCTGFHNQTPLRRVPEQGLALRQPHRREAVRVPRHRRDERRAARRSNLTLTAYSAGPVLGRRAALLRPVRRARRPRPARPGRQADRRPGPPAAHRQHRVRRQARQPPPRPDPPAALADRRLERLGPPAPGAHRRHPGAVQASVPDLRPEVPRDDAGGGGSDGVSPRVLKLRSPAGLTTSATFALRFRGRAEIIERDTINPLDAASVA